MLMPTGWWWEPRRTRLRVWVGLLHALLCVAGLVVYGQGLGW